MKRNWVHVAVIFALTLGFAVPADSSVFGDLMDRLRGQKIEQGSDQPADIPAGDPVDQQNLPGDGAVIPPADTTADPLVEVRSLLRDEKYRDAVEKLGVLAEADEDGKLAPFCRYLMGQISLFHMQDETAARGYFQQCADKSGDTRYGRLAAERVRLLRQQTRTETALQDELEATRQEIDLKTKAYGETSWYDMLTRAKLRRELEALQERYVTQKELLSDFRESPESLLDREEGTAGSTTPRRAGTTPPAKRMAVCTGDRYRIRESAGTDGKVLGYLNKGDRVEIIGVEKKDDGTWFKISKDGAEGWTFESGLRLETPGTQTPSETAGSTARKGRCIRDGYNVRKGPWGDKCGSLKIGERVTILGETLHQGKKWYQIRYSGGEGYAFHEGIAVDGETTPGGPGEPQDEFQTGIVRNLAKILYVNGRHVLQMSEVEMFTHFMQTPELGENFPDVLAKRDRGELKKIAEGLMRMLHFTPLRRALGDELARNDYPAAYRKYQKEYTDNYDDPAIYPFKQDALPVMIVNIPARRLRIYRDGLKIFDVPIVPGRSNKDNTEGGNIQTRVGKFKLESWHQEYTTAAYPVKYSENMWKAAFGLWAAKFGPNSNGQHMHGTYGPKWLGNVPINYAPGSHGCIRVANKNILLVHEMCPPGTRLIKTYCVHERTASRFLGRESFKDEMYENIYDYKVDDPRAGIFFPEAGVLLDHQEPEDAVR